MSTEETLKLLKVVDLKQLLTKANLSTAGRKDELIARLLENGQTAGEEALAAGTEGTSDSVEDEPSKEESTADEPSTGEPSTEGTSDAKPVEEEETEPQVVEPDAKQAPSEPTAVSEEIEKRKSRAARFGVPYNDSKPTPPKAKTNTVPPPATKPLSAKKSEPAPVKEVDPVEEEKKRKRLEKFGPVRPATEEKKAKTEA